MSDESQRPIIVKRIKKGGHGHHGGSWKIAYADFVTAMMAFFLLMWLLSSVSQSSLEGIAEYFKTPLQAALDGGKGLAAQPSSVIKGGGTDLTRQAGQVRKVPADDSQTEKQKLSQLQRQIENSINENTLLKPYGNQLQLEMTPEGLKIEIIDTNNRPMFNSGSTSMLPYTRVLLQALAEKLNQIPNTLSISGHTDATPYNDARTIGYSNWELSADRANAARRELMEDGLYKDKILRVVGMADVLPLNKENVFAPENRRITIVVLNKEAEANILSRSKSDDAGNP